MDFFFYYSQLGGQTAPVDWFGALNVTYMTGPGFSNSR